MRAGATFLVFILTLIVPATSLAQAGLADPPAPRMPALGAPSAPAAAAPTPAPARSPVYLDSLPPPKRLQEPGSHWYGWEIILSDVASLSVLGIGAASGDDAGASMGISILGYVFVPPTLHLAHNNYGRAGLSLLTRIGFPVVGALIGYEDENCSSSSDRSCGSDGAVIGGIVGLGTAMILDAALLARDYAPKDQAPSSASMRWTLAPSMGKSRGGLSFGGVF
ncbi:MAG: hypothetical protein HY898_28575 [Deltaproteobacteria bacterium]|nr:hypothetical protein [Deltaproteobacteria bacterium]